MATSSWSATYRLVSQDHLQIQHRPGVYRIRAYNDSDQAIPIARANGVDGLGLLHIGQSIRLGTRIREFRQAAEGRKAAHPAGREYKRWEFSRLFPFGQLRFDYVLEDNQAEAIKVERELHEEYRRRYLDRPPLDSQSGQDVAARLAMTTPSSE